VRWLLEVCVVVLLVGLVEARVLAYENQFTLGVSTGYSGLPTAPDELPDDGFMTGLTAGWGINDAWGLQGNLSYSFHPDEEPLQIGILGIETTYLLDIVRFVPVAGAGIDGLMTIRQGGVQGDFAVHALLGVDFLINPRWLIGLDTRFYWIPAELSSDLSPFMLTAAFRASYRFDLF
jgi:hypothetical protein